MTPRYTPSELRAVLGSGLLSFPVTHMSKDLEIDEASYRGHLQYLTQYDVAGLFAPGGTGEFFSLTAAEASHVTRMTVHEASRRVPVLGSAGHGATAAVQLARQAEADGADGVLLFPPYSAPSPSSGLYEYAARVCEATRGGVVVYNRDAARYTPHAIERLTAEFPNFIGVKDGICDIELMSALSAEFPDRLLLIGGMPTAEVYAPSYLELGATTYSSAIFNFAPQWALDFYSAARARDRSAILSAMCEFLIPYTRIRNRQPGYGVSIIKAALRLVDRPAGPVRPPLADLNDAELGELAELLKVVK